MGSFNTAGALLCCAAIALAAGCDKSSKKQSGDYAKLTDELWALAPANTIAGFVAGDTTGAELIKAVEALEKAVESRPGGKELVAKVRSELIAEVSVDVLDPAAVGAYGFDSSRGAALFVDKDEKVIFVIPVSNRETFLSKVEGKTEDGVDRFKNGKGACKEISGRYVCAETVELLEPVGKSDEMKKRVAGLTRGHIEVWADLNALGVDDAPWKAHVSDAGIVTAAVQMESGGFTVHGHLVTKPASSQAKALGDVSSELAKAVAEEKPGGVIRLSLPIFGGLVPKGAAAEALAGAAMLGINAEKDIIDNVTGEMVIYSPPAEHPGLVVKVGLKNGASLQPAITALCGVAAMQAPQFSPKLEGERCQAEVDLTKLAEQMPEVSSLPFTGKVTIAAYVEDKALVLSAKQAAGPGSGKVEQDDLGKDLTTGEWNFALVSRGIGASAESGKALEQLRSNPEIYKLMSTIGWAAAHISEMSMGFAMRKDGAHGVMRVGTQFANSEEVLAEFQSILTRIFDGDAGAMADLDKLAEKHSDSPLGRAHAAGRGGLAGISGAASGLGAAVAIPSFVKYVNRSKSTEAVQFVRKIYDGARAHYIAPPQSGDEPVGSHFPKQSVGPTPPLGTCCKQPDKKCAPNPSQWEHPTWVALQFSVDDPHFYSYQYEVIEPEKEFVVRAMGDLDCDGVYSTFEMRGIVPPGGDDPGGDAVVRRMNELE